MPAFLFLEFWVLRVELLRSTLNPQRDFTLDPGLPVRHSLGDGRSILYLTNH